MPTALRKSLKVQRAAEVSWGTPVSPATSILAGLNEIRYGADDVLGEPDELNGILSKVTGAPDVLGTGGKLTLGGYLTYQDFPYILESAYKTATPSGDAGTPVAYTRTYAPTNTAEDTPKSATLEAGGASEAFQFPGSVVQSFGFTAAVRGYTMFTSNWIAKDMITQAFSGALARRTVTRVKAGLWTAALDTTWAGLGGTPITSCVTNIAFNSGNRFVFSNCIQGATTPTGIAEETAQQADLTLTIKLDTFTSGLLATYRAGSLVFLRLKNLGATAIHGTPNVFPTIQLDMAAYIANWPEVGQAVADNALTIPIVFRSAYDTVGANSLVFSVVNAVATLA